MLLAALAAAICDDPTGVGISLVASTSGALLVIVRTGPSSAPTPLRAINHVAAPNTAGCGSIVFPFPMNASGGLTDAPFPTTPNVPTMGPLPPPPPPPPLEEPPGDDTVPDIEVPLLPPEIVPVTVLDPPPPPDIAVDAPEFNVPTTSDARTVPPRRVASATNIVALARTFLLLI